MAIGTVTAGSNSGYTSSAPGGSAVAISFPGDGAYPTGGTAGFEGTVRTALAKDVTIVGLVSGDCGIYVAQYDRANDKLKVRTMVDGTEVANTTNLSGTTFNVVLLVK